MPRKWDGKANMDGQRRITQLWRELEEGKRELEEGRRARREKGKGKVPEEGVIDLEDDEKRGEKDSEVLEASKRSSGEQTPSGDTAGARQIKNIEAGNDTTGAPSEERADRGRNVEPEDGQKNPSSEARVSSEQPGGTKDKQGGLDAAHAMAHRFQRLSTDAGELEVAQPEKNERQCSEKGAVEEEKGAPEVGKESGAVREPPTDEPKGKESAADQSAQHRPKRARKPTTKYSP